jgi:aminopeptidase-like protein
MLPSLEIHEVPSGTKAYDWEVPREWRIRDAYIITPGGKKICNFNENNLHVLGYSVPIRAKMSLQDLQKNLHSLPSQPNAIPYITSYYKDNWGFCIADNQRQDLVDGEYEIFIDSDLFNGALTYAEILLPGQSSKEILISTNICHPSMANNEISGPCVVTYLAKKIESIVNRRFTYRIIFIPETIGSVLYLSRHINHLKLNVVAGFNIVCIGDNRAYSYMPSREGGTLSDRVAIHVLKNIDTNYKAYKWLERGSDERQYCAPGVDLPIASIFRTKYGEYDE